MLSIRNCITSSIKSKHIENPPLINKAHIASISKNKHKLQPCQVISGIRLPGLLSSPTPLLDKDEV